MDELVHCEVAAGVATITLDSPANRNALSAQVRRELLAHLDTALDDDAARVVVLTHTGRVFCSGMDLKESRGAGAANQGVNEVPTILSRIWTAPKPVVARIAGPARAGGVGLVSACDIAVAADAATFAFSEVRIGVIPAVISVTVLPRLVARAAHELFLTGETFDAARAVAIGLINAAVSADRLDAEVARYVEMLRLGAPGALAATKAMLRTQRPAGMEAQFADMLSLSAQYFAAEEGQEGMRAFAEKRPPTWVAAGVTRAAPPRRRASALPGRVAARRGQRAVERRRVRGCLHLSAEPAAVAAHARDRLDAREHGRGQRLRHGDRLTRRRGDVPPVHDELARHHRADHGGGHRGAAEGRVALPGGRVAPGTGRGCPGLRRAVGPLRLRHTAQVGAGLVFGPVGRP